jgi:hypothetical protein
MGFTGSLILARTPDSLIDVLAPLEAELVGRRDDHWQLAAVIGDFPDIPGMAAALVEATAAPVLIAVVDFSGLKPRRPSVHKLACRNGVSDFRRAAG